MEIVLQWLDELDDLVFSAFFLWHKLRVVSLPIALTAAVGLHAVPWLGIPFVEPDLLVCIALSALAVWAVAGTVATRAERRSLFSFA